MNDFFNFMGRTLWFFMGVRFWVIGLLFLQYVHEQRLPLIHKHATEFGNPLLILGGLLWTVFFVPTIGLAFYKYKRID